MFFTPYSSNYFTCQNCGALISITDETCQIHEVSYDANATCPELGVKNIGKVRVFHHFCPACGKYSLAITMNEKFGNIAPFEISKPPKAGVYVPSYVPSQIMLDYFEALDIVEISPKASATLSRRCLQGMIRDFWGIRKRTLNEEITALKGHILPSQWEVIDCLRRYGNIGAHMEVDVNQIVDVSSDEARLLLELLEHLFKDWYIERHDRDELYDRIRAADAETQAKRKNSD